MFLIARECWIKGITFFFPMKGQGRKGKRVTWEMISNIRKYAESE